MQEEPLKKDTYWLVFTLVGGCIVSVIFCLYFFFIQKQYNYLIETECNPEKEECFVRDCESEDSDCPPNGFSYYKKYSISAKDFKMCPEENCQALCESGGSSCVQTKCAEADFESGGCVASKKSPITSENKNL